MISATTCNGTNGTCTTATSTPCQSGSGYCSIFSPSSCANRGDITWFHHVANADVRILAINGGDLYLGCGWGSAGAGSTTTFGGSTFTVNGASDIALAILDKTSGAHLSSVPYGGASGEYPFAMAVSALGEVFLQGIYGFDGTGLPANLGGGSTHDLPYAGGTGLDIFFAEYNPDLTWRWSRRAGGTDDDQPGNTNDFDSGSNAYTSGKWRLSTDFGTGPLTAVGDSDAFYVRYDTTDTAGKSIYFQTQPYNFTEGVLSVLGTTVLAGSFTASITLDGANTLTSAGGSDVFAAAYNSAGTLQWKAQIGGAGDELGLAMARDTTGHVYIAGGFSQSMTVQTVSGPKVLTSNGGTDIFVLRLNATGGIDWAISFGGPGNEGVFQISCPTGGSLAIAGDFFSQVNFGSGVRTAMGSARDAFVAVFNGANGAPLWDREFGGALDDYALATVVDTDGTVYTSIDFQATVDFGTGTPITVPANQFDSEVLRLTK